MTLAYAPMLAWAPSSRREGRRPQQGEETAPESPAKIVLAIGGRGKLHVDDLFTFSQVTLVRLSQHLQTRGIKVEVIAIPSS